MPGGVCSCDLAPETESSHYVRVTSATLRWNLLGKNLDVKLSVVGRENKEHILAEDFETAAGSIAVPQAALGGRELVFRLLVTSRHNSPQIVLTGVRLEATVGK